MADPTTVAGDGAPWVLPLSDPRAHDPRRAGRKAAVLSTLLAEGMAVPGGFVVTAGAATRLDDPAVVEEVGKALADLGSCVVAVRSSGVAEDGADASYAGQYETVLGVEGLDAVLAAARRCVDSARSARAERYREGRGDGTAMAVLVQRQLEPRAAGVAFSADPVTGDRDRVVIEATTGLADRLVSGEVEAERWQVAAGSAERVGGEPVLSAGDVEALAGLVRRLEARGGTPQDVEWAIDDQARWILQARPITVLPVAPEVDAPEAGTWMKDTSHYPEPITPFGASVYLPTLEAATGEMCDEWGLMVERVEIRALGHEVYTRIVPAGGKDGPAPPWWALAILSRLVPPIRRRMAVTRAAVRAGRLEAVPRQWVDEWKGEFEAAFRRLRDVDLRGLDDGALVAHLGEAEALLQHGQRVHFRLFLPYVVAMYELARTCEQLLGWPTGRALQLVAGHSQASAAPTVALRALAAEVAATPAAREAVERGDLEALTEAAPDVAAAFERYRREYGARTIGYDPGSPSLGERPGLLLRLLADAVDRGQTDGDPAGAARLEARREADRALADRPADQRRLHEVLARAEEVYGLREENVLVTDFLPSGLLRRAALEIGRRLAERERLGRADDVVYLEGDEMRRALVADDGEVDWAALTGRRRAERAFVVAHPGPEYRGAEPSEPPDVRGLPPEARRVNGAILWAVGEEFAAAALDAGSDVVARGVGASAGRYTGPVRLVRSEREFDRLRSGDVLVCPITTPAWSVLFGSAGAIVTDTGGALSHAAIVAREHGIPAVLGTATATAELREGQVVTVDGSAGTVVEVAQPTA